MDDNDIIEQLENGTFDKKKRKYVKKKDIFTDEYKNLVLSKGEIRQYARNINVIGEFNTGFCVILENSKSEYNRILICPIYEIDNKALNNHQGIKIGLLNLDGKNKEYIAACNEIRLVSKKRFLVDNINREPYKEKLTNLTIYKILYVYLIILKSIMDESTEIYKKHVCWDYKLVDF